MTAPVFTRSLIAQALQSPPTPPALWDGPDFTAILTDSRKIIPGCLFVALKGDTFDGHDFIPMAIEKGAQGILSEKPLPPGLNPGSLPRGLAFYQVKSTESAYRAIGHAWRRNFNLPVIAVAGSVGKTSTKDLLHAILQGKYPRVLKTSGSQNGFVGIPMTLLELRADHGAAVIEVGIDEIGSMEEHIPLVAPTASLLTAIGPEHLEKLRDLETVAREELLALSLVKDSGGLTIVNLDDAFIAKKAPKLHGYGHTLRCSLSEDHRPDDVTLTGKLNPGTSTLVCSGLGLNDETFPLPLPGRHNASNLLIALTTALGLGLSAEEIRNGLATFKAAQGRSELRHLKDGTPVVCDYYNANPSSMEAGFELLTEIATAESGPSRTRFACLADMLELGPNEELFHRNLADRILTLGIENVLLYGPRMRFLYTELQTRGFKGSVNYFTTQEQMGQHLLTQLTTHPRAAILIKGSRGMKMENVLQLLNP